MLCRSEIPRYNKDLPDSRSFSFPFRILQSNREHDECKYKYAQIIIVLMCCLCAEDRRTDSETTSLTRILTPNDEFQFWADVSMSASKLAVRERAQAFHGVFQSVVHDFANLDSLSFDGALELIEVSDVLNY